MALKFNNTEVENVYFNGTKIDRVYFNNTLVYESTVYVDKPTVSGSFTYDKAEKQATITGYDSAAMTMSGAASATEAGTYHVYFTLNKGYAWKDGTTTKLDLTWSIAKRTITIPSLSATSFTWVEGTVHAVTVNNLDTDYVTQSGTLSQTDSSSNVGAKYTVTWTLKNTNSTYWESGSTADQSAQWGVYWVNGTSHYSNDLYNCGWNSGKLTVGPYISTVATATFEPDHIAWTVLSTGSSASNPYTAFMYETAGAPAAGKTIHVSGTGTLALGYFYQSGSDEYTTGPYPYPSASNPSDFSYKYETTATKYKYFIGGYKKSSGTITRIWLT